MKEFLDMLQTFLLFIACLILAYIESELFEILTMLKEATK